MMDTQSQLYTGHGFSFHFPMEAVLLESKRPDDSYLVRVLHTFGNTEYRYDIEKMSGRYPASVRVEKYFRQPIPQPEDIAPEQVEINGMNAWHTRKVVIEGLHAVLMYDAFFLDWENGVLRFHYMTDLRGFATGLPAFQEIVRSFRV